MATRDYKESLKDIIKTPDDMAAYINAVLDEDPSALPLALRNLADIGGMTRLARITGLNRTGLYNMLEKNGNPEWSSLYKILRAFNVRLSARTVNKDENSTNGHPASG